MKQNRKDILNSAKEIAEEYDGNLTVRQLYYQLVAGGHIANSQESYKRLVSLLTDARLSGDFPIEWLIDRTRESRPGDFTKHDIDVDDALDEVANSLKQAPEWWLTSDRWYGQPMHVSVWVEKEALMGVFEKPCDDLGVSWFVLRGYSSLSALSQWLDGLVAAYRANPAIDEAIILYFGDHDPDGWEIPRSAERNLQAIIEVRGLDVPPIRFERCALLMEQIRAFNPPPFPAKESSARFSGYIAEHGITDAWELDALKPTVLDKLIRAKVDDHFDHAVWNVNRAEVMEARGKLKLRIRDPEWIKDVLV